MNKKLKLVVCGILAGLASLSLASVPGKGRVTDDTVIYQKLSEIRVSREAELNFDSDLSRLSQIEGRYAEKLPRLSGPMQRISAQKYKYSGNQKPSVTRN